MAAICVFCASSTSIDQRWLDLATETGKELAARGHTLVSGGGKVGMMGTVAAGARAGGAHTLGIIPQTLVDWEVADTDADELVVTGDMASRKNLMIERSDAFLTLPGGLGTLDELFEAATLIQCGKIGPFPLMLLGEEFWKGMRDYLLFMVDQGVFDAKEVGFGRIIDSPSEAVEMIVRALPTSVKKLLKPLKT